jgi:hypothetical protein
MIVSNCAFMKSELNAAIDFRITFTLRQRTLFLLNKRSSGLEPIRSREILVRELRRMTMIEQMLSRTSLKCSFALAGKLDTSRSD